MIAGAAHKHDDAAGHVLAEEVARVPADDDDRHFPPYCFMLMPPRQPQPSRTMSSPPRMA